MKKYSQKEGSTYEDLGLIAALHEIITNVYKLTAEIGELNRILLRIGKLPLAKELQTKLSQLLDLVKNQILEIWRDAKVISPQDEDMMKFGPEATIADIIQDKKAKGGYVSEYGLLGKKGFYGLKSILSNHVYFPFAEPHLRFPPTQVPNESWKLQILN